MKIKQQEFKNESIHAKNRRITKSNFDQGNRSTK